MVDTFLYFTFTMFLSGVPTFVKSSDRAILTILRIDSLLHFIKKSFTHRKTLSWTQYGIHFHSVIRTFWIFCHRSPEGNILVVIVPLDVGSKLEVVSLLFVGVFWQRSGDVEKVSITPINSTDTSFLTNYSNLVNR